MNYELLQTSVSEALRQGIKQLITSVAHTSNDAAIKCLQAATNKEKDKPKPAPAKPIATGIKPRLLLLPSLVVAFLLVPVVGIFLPVSRARRCACVRHACAALSMCVRCRSVVREVPLGVPGSCLVCGSMRTISRWHHACMHACGAVPFPAPHLSSCARMHPCRYSTTQARRATRSSNQHTTPARCTRRLRTSSRHGGTARPRPSRRPMRRSWPPRCSGGRRIVAWYVCIHAWRRQASALVTWIINHTSPSPHNHQHHQHCMACGTWPPACVPHRPPTSSTLTYCTLPLQL